MTTTEIIQRTRQRLTEVYDATLRDLGELPDAQLTEMEHEAEHYRTAAEFTGMVAGMIVSTEARLILDERQEPHAKPQRNQ